MALIIQKTSVPQHQQDCSKYFENRPRHHPCGRNGLVHCMQWLSNANSDETSYLATGMLHRDHSATFSLYVTLCSPISPNTAPSHGGSVPPFTTPFLQPTPHHPKRHLDRISHLSKMHGHYQWTGLTDCQTEWRRNLTFTNRPLTLCDKATGPTYATYASNYRDTLQNVWCIYSVLTWTQTPLITTYLHLKTRHMLLPFSIFFLRIWNLWW